MDDTELTAQWSPLKRSIKARWPRLTDDDLEAVGGHIDHLCARIRERYAISDAEARRQFAQFAEHLATPTASENSSQTAGGAAGGQSSPGQSRPHHPGAPVAASAPDSQARPGQRTDSQGG